MVRRSIRRWRPGSCGCRRQIVRQSASLLTRRSWKTRSTRPCSSTNARLEKREQKHFEQAIGQLERFVDDKVLVCRRERASIAEKLRSAKARRDTVVGSTARDRVEEEIVVWRPRTMRSNAVSARWIPGRTRSTENGETNITSFGTGPQP